MAGAASTSASVAPPITAQVPSVPTSDRATCRPSGRHSWSRWMPDTSRGSSVGNRRATASAVRSRRATRPRHRSPPRPARAPRSTASSSPTRPTGTAWPSPVTTSRPTTLSEVRPWRSECGPQASLPSMPPSVARLVVDGSGPNRSPCGAAAACRSASTTPGSTVAVRAPGSRSRMRVRCREVSTTTPRPVACPAWLVPPPRSVTGTPRTAQTATAARSASTVRGATTPSGTCR